MIGLPVKSIKFVPRKAEVVVKFSSLSLANQAYKKLKSAPIAHYGQILEINWGRDEDMNYSDLSNQFAGDLPYPPCPVEPVLHDDVDKQIIDRVARAVANKGASFEATLKMLMLEEFRFLNDFDYLNPYYRFKVWTFTHTDKNPEIEYAAVEKYLIEQRETQPVVPSQSLDGNQPNSILSIGPSQSPDDNQPNSIQSTSNSHSQSNNQSTNSTGATTKPGLLGHQSSSTRNQLNTKRKPTNTQSNTNSNSKRKHDTSFSNRPNSHWRSDDFPPWETHPRVTRRQYPNPRYPDVLEYQLQSPPPRHSYSSQYLPDQKHYPETYSTSQSPPPRDYLQYNRHSRGSSDPKLSFATPPEELANSFGTFDKKILRKAKKNQPSFPKPPTR